MNAIRRLQDLGQSVWLDFIDRHMLTSGELARMIDESGLAGLTSNPTIFEKAVAGSSDYDSLIASARPTDDDATVFERLQVRDVTHACDVFLPVYERTGGADGFVSIEVSPKLARDTPGSLDDARRLWEAIRRPNLMVKIPGTQEGLGAIERCLTEGININVTLLFSVARYLEIVLAYLGALEARLREGKPIDHVASVASFFVSRVDTKMDRILDGLEGNARECGLALRGKIAIANAKLAYAECERIMSTKRWRDLASKGARRQRLLWGSSSAKDPAYPDTYYVDALVGPHTIDTMPLETFRAYIDHGKPEVRLTPDGSARQLLDSLETIGLDFARITDELEEEGVRAFAQSFDRALASIAGKRRLLKPG
jgi:transaldolase